jgi:hypothetical protein
MKSAMLLATGIILTLSAAPASAGLIGDIIGGILPGGGGSGPTPTPEISPESARGAWALLVGGMLMLGDRLRRR